MNIKIRTTIIALVASTSFAATSVVPTVSQATQNTGAYSKSSEAQKQAKCERLGKWFEEDVNAADKAGKTEGYASTKFKDAMAGAALDVAAAKQAGCSWAARVQPAPKHLPAYGLGHVGGAVSR
jgi:hypothetical protein